jgi:hypothetical protein
MATLEVAFANGIAPVANIGQKTKVRFAYTWANGDTWAASVVSSLSGNFTLGKGNIAGQTYTAALKLRDRMYLGFGASFALSAVGDVTKWEEQDAGSAVISYVSQFGNQDTVVAFASLQGRLAVFGGQSIQTWSLDADPNQLSLFQTMDNTGTRAGLSVQSIGDLDVLYLDRSGVRSLRAKESTLNAYVNDIGTAIDTTIRSAMVSFDESASCAIVEPRTRQYWLYLNGVIYVLSYYLQSKIVAWSTFTPTAQIAPTTTTYGVDGFARYTVVPGFTYYWVRGHAGSELQSDLGAVLLSASGSVVPGLFDSPLRESGTSGQTVDGQLFVENSTGTFVVEKFIVIDDQVYFRTTGKQIYRFGGSSGAAYDLTQATIELPWLELNKGALVQLEGVQTAMKGGWTIQVGTNPLQASLSTIVDQGSLTTPSMLTDSTSDHGRCSARGTGSHVKIKAVSDASNTEAKLAKLGIIWKKLNAQ